MNKVSKKKGFILVELLAVIIILAIILVIAVPQLMETIEKSKKSSFETSAKLIISSAETEYLTRQALGESTSDIECSDVTNIDTNEYESCNITFNEKGEATIKVVGKGQFEALNVCNGTRGNVEVTEGACPITTLASGTTFNKRIKRLVNTSATHLTDDTTITSIEILGDGILPEGYTKDTLTALETKVDVSEKGDN